MNKKSKIILLIVVLSLSINLMSISPAQASASENSCTIWANSPTQVGNTLYTRGYAKCLENGYSLSYLQLCIVKKTWLGNKTIKCTPAEIMGGYLGIASNKTLQASCDGKGTYYAEMRWQEFGINDISSYIKGIDVPGGIIFFAKLGLGRYKVTVPSVAYPYCG